jgi:hippurate hydrolase
MTVYFSKGDALQPANLIAEIVANHDSSRALRQDIHAHPELCFAEVRTAELVATQLAAWGIPLERGMGKTGVVGIIKSGDSERAIGLRADMDALPITEQNQFAHSSRHPGKMHACGHDGHTAMLLAAAQHLASNKTFDGTVYLIFQPAEEEGGGANVMIQDGLFERFTMQAVYGMHNWPGMAAGQFAVSSGPVMASSNTFNILIRGQGCHAALPHLGLDPVPVAAQIILALQTILTRNVNPLEAGLLSVTMVHAGQAYNVIADHCELAGTVRTFSAELLDLLEQRMQEIARHICLAHGMDCDFTFKRNYPTTVNHLQPTAIARQVMTEIVGAENVLPQQPTMGAEDFGFMLQKIPGCYCFIGNGAGEHRSPGHGTGPCMLHNASYDFNDDILPLGATYWVKLVEACLPKESA